MGNKNSGRRRAPWRDYLTELEQDKYYKWQLHCAQAKFRGESHSLTFEQWNEIWRPEDWYNRGTQADHVCLTMIDPELGWHFNNVEIVTRKEQLRRQGFLRTGMTYNKKTRHYD